MKKLFSKNKIVVAIAAVLIITVFSSFMGLVITEKPVSRTIEVAIYSAADYSQEIYKKSKAKVYVTVSKYKNNKFEVVYAATFKTGSLSKVPSEKNALVKAIQVNNFYAKHEILVAKYTISYESNGDVITYNKYVLLPGGKAKEQFAITI